MKSNKKQNKKEIETHTKCSDSNSNDKERSSSTHRIFRAIRHMPK